MSLAYTETFPKSDVFGCQKNDIQVIISETTSLKQFVETMAKRSFYQPQRYKFCKIYIKKNKCMAGIKCKWAKLN